MNDKIAFGGSVFYIQYANRHNTAAEHAFALQCLKGLVEKHNIVFVST